MENIRFTVASVADGETEHVVLGAPPSDPVAIRGRVVSAGEGFPGAIVTFIPAEGGYGAMRLTTSGDEGRFTLELDAPGEHLVQVQMIDGVDQTSIEFLETVPEKDEHTVEFVLPGAAISGRVTDGRGQALAGTRVSIYTDGGVAYGTMVGGHYGEGTTQEDGTYAFHFLRPGTYVVAAGGLAGAGMIGGSAKYGRSVQQGIQVQGDQARTGIDFRLEAAGALVGTVKDPAGAPVAGAAIFLRDGDGVLIERFSMVMTDPGGRFRCEGIGPGDYSAAARKDGEASPASGMVRVQAEQDTSVDLVLSTGTLLEVVVLDKTGAPIRVTLSVTNSAGHEVAGMLSYQDLLDGTFLDGGAAQSVGPLPPDHYRVTVESRDGRTASRPVTLKGRATRKLKLRL